jgi:Recombination endonuclease VII
MRCPKCGVEKELSEFPPKKVYHSPRPNPRRFDNPRECKACKYARSYAWFAGHPNAKRDYSRKYMSTIDGKMRHLSQRYGVNKADVERLYERAAGCCEACGAQFKTKKHEPCLDHDHETKHVRGLLCRKCNWAEGILKVNPKVFEQLRDYLARYGTPVTGSNP